jgi:hypothetical protein
MVLVRARKLAPGTYAALLSGFLCFILDETWIQLRNIAIRQRSSSFHLSKNNFPLPRALPLMSYLDLLGVGGQATAMIGC